MLAHHEMAICHSCKEDMADVKSWLVHEGLIFHPTGSCRAMWERLRGKDA